MGDGPCGRSAIPRTRGLRHSTKRSDGFTALRRDTAKFECGMETLEEEEYNANGIVKR